MASSSHHFLFPLITSLLFLTISLLLPQISAGDSLSCNFPAIFNFGDSNSDTGGLSAAFRPTPPPTGETFFGMPVGRYCDGRLVIDFIAKSLGLPYINAYLDSIGTNFSHGANFATAGSTIRRQNTSLFQSGYSPFSLDVQSWQFSQFMSRSQFVSQNDEVFKRLLPTNETFSKALYTFDIGQNDLTQGYFSNMTTEEVAASIPDLTERFISVIKNIYSLGGRYFWIHNSGPSGCLPYILERLPQIGAEQDEAGCDATFNNLAQTYNMKLKDAVAQLRTDLPLAVFTYVDVYSAKYELFRHAKKHGFEHPLLSCCGYGGKYNFNFQVVCGGKITVNNTEILIGSCEEPSKRICWDGIHYTEAGNKFVFDQIVEGGLSDPPVPIRMACQREA